MYFSSFRRRFDRKTINHYRPVKIASRTYRKQARIHRVIYTILATDSAVYDAHRTSIIRKMFHSFVKRNKIDEYI